MERLIIAVIIIAAVLFLFNSAQKSAGGGSQIPGPTNPNSALPAGYRTSPGS